MSALSKDQFLATADELVVKDDDDTESSLAGYIIDLLSRIENLEQSEQQTVPHSWNFHVIRDAQGFIRDVEATPVLH